MEDPPVSDSLVSETEVVAGVRRAGAIAILRLREHTHAVALGQLLLDAGLPVMEVTFDHPGAPAALRCMVDQLPAAALLGAGTVRTTQQISWCKDAGGRFCVSPHTDPDLIGACIDAGLEPIPGAQTATDVATATDAGARLIKLFPAGPLGLRYLRAMLGPFSDVLFVPTGGIRHDEVGTWLQAGAVAVGLGSDLVPAVPSQSELDAIARRARKVSKQIADTRAR
jgi:2-dehydro-3-deoxyphosphogluconate aldolase / (4S)-4-hydroxy-2-oxoglutarate aldolase